MCDDLENIGYRVSLFTCTPGSFFPTHTHNVDKMDGVLSGRFHMTMGGKSEVLQARNGPEVLAGEPHSAEVLGDEPVVSLGCILV